MTTRVALYARYSSDLQNEKSAEDQLAALRLAVISRGWTVVAEYKDEGISGQALATRPGIQALLKQAMTGAVDVVFAEALDRLSRSQSDTARLFELLRFYGVELETLGSGKISELHIGLEGTMNRLFLVELGKKSRRGMIARAREGFTGSGKTYGYDVTGQGTVAINPTEAQIVRRIFEAYAAGKSTRTIVGSLNREGVPSARGGKWSPGALRGYERGGNITGILCREVYAGVRVFNVRHWKKHPETGKRTAVLNPPDQWVRSLVPDLRIVSDEVWGRVQERLKLRIEQPMLARQPKRLLSGLMRCGLCGSAMRLNGGKCGPILRCVSNADGSVCTNSKAIRASTVEARVVRGIRDKLLEPAVIEAEMRQYLEREEEERRAAMRDRAIIERELEEIGRRITRLTDSYERGVLELDDFEQRIIPLKGTRQELRNKLALAAKPEAVPLHPRLADYCRELADQLTQALEDPDGDELRDLLRSAIQRVVFHPEKGRGEFSLDIHGKLATLLGFTPEVGFEPTVSFAA